jgi:hypothetical protein
MCPQPHPRDFRPLNPLEISTIENAVKKHRLPADGPLYTDSGQVVVSYEGMQGGFTVCVVALECADGLIIWRGASRRSYRDARNALRGEMLAFSRAVMYSRPSPVLGKGLYSDLRALTTVPHEEAAPEDQVSLATRLKGLYGGPLYVPGAVERATA